MLLGLAGKNFPGAMKCVNRLISVPLYPALRDADVTYLLQTLEEELADRS
jgi:dTDP-4-amino-4,6-dideoxygalactose transaminase